MPTCLPKLMPSLLGDLETRFNARLNTLDSAFDRFLVSRTSSYRSDRSFFQEGLVSTLWQSWCLAVRTLIIASVKGAITKTGIVTVSPHSGLLDAELAYIASKAARSQAIGNIIPLLGSHLEPTWGDLNKVGLISNGFSVSNGPQLASALSSPSSLKDLQTCRNACAHLNADRIVDVKSTRIRYASTSMMHPSDMIFWLEPSTNDFLWRTWTDEMRVAYGLATH